MAEAHAVADEEPSSGEMEPLIKKEDTSPASSLEGDPQANSTIIDVESKDSAHDAVRKSMGEATFASRRNHYVDLQMKTSDRTSLQQRKIDYSSQTSRTKAQRKGLLEVIIVNLKAIQDVNPVLKGTLQEINSTFGSGISSLFYDWRWLVLLNFLVWIVWFVFTTWIWLLDPPTRADSDPPYAPFWKRNDLSFSNLMMGSSAAADAEDKSTLVQDSFLFYTGYVPGMGTTGHYPMGAAWVACVMGTILILFANINGRLILSLKLRRHDPVVEALVDYRGGDTLDHKTGWHAQEILFGSYDFSAYSAQGQYGSMKGLLTGLETLVHASYKALAVPAHLQMGNEVFEIKCIPPGVVKGEENVSINTYKQMVKGESAVSVSVGQCIVDNVVLCRKLQAGVASVVATQDELNLALQTYLKANPAAEKVAAVEFEDAQEGVTENVAKRSVIKCILAYGELWTPPNTTTREDWKPSASYTETKQSLPEHASAFVFTLRHGEAKSNSDVAKQVVGILLTLVCFAISATGVYGIIVYAEELELYGGTYAVTGLLVLIQNVIPLVVKMIVKFEGWSNEETVMQWTLMRVYFLKMANLCVLLLQLEKLGQQEGQCVTFEVGIYLYQLVITGSIAGMVSNWATYFLTYRFAGPTGADKVEYDNQTVAQTYIELNYNTALVWIAYPMSPMVVFVAALLGLCEMAWLAQCLKWFCKVADKPFQANATTKMLVMAIFFVTFGYSCIPATFFLTNKPHVLWTVMPGAVGNATKIPMYCGPIEPTEVRYEALLNFLLGWWPQMQNTLGYVTNPVLLFGLISILCVVVAFNNEAAGMARSECADTYLDKANSEAALRSRRIMNRILESEKAVLTDRVMELETKVQDMERGTLSKATSEVKSSFFGRSTALDPEGNPQKKKGMGCFG